MGANEEKLGIDRNRRVAIGFCALLQKLACDACNWLDGRFSASTPITENL